MSFEHAVAYVLDLEGVEANHPDDPGGHTMYGISEPLARRYGFRPEEITQEIAVMIYRKEFWESPFLNLEKLHERSAVLATKVFEWAVSTGPREPAQALQRILNRCNKGGDWYADIRVDGWIGPATRRALKTYFAERGEKAGTDTLLAALSVEQGADYGQHVDEGGISEAFYEGLINRLHIDVTLET